MTIYMCTGGGQLAILLIIVATSYAMCCMPCCLACCMGKDEVKGTCTCIYTIKFCNTDPTAHHINFIV